ncbi:nucleoside hydrolase [Hominenteromicrobium sp.]|uniref:nucleoside hydrolase n=1 Tax=Hominenteromicrobium sp. TaxID=3073581 RepID=UPI003AB803D2
MNWTVPNTESLLRRLTKPNGKIDVVLDTDTYNEVDDQFALSYMIKNSDKLNVKALYAAPFLNANSVSPKDGMEKSYDEILKLLTLLKREDLKSVTFKGSETYLTDEDTPVLSPAAEDLSKRAMDYTPEKPLYVVAIGAITNVASALLLKPEIRDRIVLVWLGGNALHWPDNREFNMYQDVAAGRIVFGCGAALVQLPCAGVVSGFSVSEPEFKDYFLGKNELCDYLAHYAIEEGRRWAQAETWSRVIWDVTAVAWLLDGEFMDDTLLHSPIPQYDDTWTPSNTRHFMRYVYNIHRDVLLKDLMQKLTEM